MDGEFDRELDDGGWGPGTGTWLTYSDQLDNVLKAADKVVEGKEKDKKLTEIKQTVEKFVKRKGKDMSETGSLGTWLWEKEKECAVQRDEAAEQEKKGR